ncbi:hypothetical protein LSH36_118g07017 [Paralvinella palmiformis]|uniref:Uncharacterized protein n=1 Tax=Paralvinella palmiformis TaxID=53620 RepID=A0AAD9N925_9ANNE|nr:hypothetical protein LSH36_118g07017 [Paralvinella palmiformis]
MSESSPNTEAARSSATRDERNEGVRQKSAFPHHYFRTLGSRFIQGRLPFFPAAAARRYGRPRWPPNEIYGTIKDPVGHSGVRPAGQRTELGGVGGAGWRWSSATLQPAGGPSRTECVRRSDLARYPTCAAESGVESPSPGLVNSQSTPVVHFLLIYIVPLLTWLSSLNQFGVTLIKDVPAEDGMVGKVYGQQEALPSESVYVTGERVVKVCQGELVVGWPPRTESRAAPVGPGQHTPTRPGAMS